MDGKPLRPICLRAAGKINLTLRVLGRRADGFHDIVSWMQPIDWWDEMTILPNSQGGLVLRCDLPELSTGSDNLICRAINALAKRAGRAPHFQIDLTKRLPMGAGLGGGSADAAAALLGAAHAWSIDSHSTELYEAAKETGSDVPFFLGTGAAIARGRGERIESHPRPFTGWAVLILPPFGISTSHVFQALTPVRQHRADDEVWVGPWQSVVEMSRHLYNDLMPAALIVEPRLRALHQQLDGVEGVTVHMSGSGSTLFALFDERRETEAWRQLDAVRSTGCALSIVRVLTTPPVNLRS